MTSTCTRYESCCICICAFVCVSAPFACVCTKRIVSNREKRACVLEKCKHIYQEEEEKKKEVNMVCLVSLPNGTTFGICCDKAIGQKYLEKVSTVI